MTLAGASWDDSTPAEALDTVEILCAHVVCRNTTFIYYCELFFMKRHTLLHFHRTILCEARGN